MVTKAFLSWTLITLLGFTSISCNGQSPKLSKSDKPVGGACEGCEAVFEFGERDLNPVDTLTGFMFSDPKLKLFGKVYQKDGKTPAGGVILYIYHTDRTGVYPRKGNETGWGKRHGYLRGWVKTDESGNYAFYTFRPAAYQDRSEPAHIHLTVKEPGKTAYYLDDFLFEDDPLLTPEKKQSFPQRGGSGVFLPIYQDGIFQIKRDIVLGINIPDYE